MIRRAINKDIPKIIDLLEQVCIVHHNIRPDIFNIGTKYKKEELELMIKDDLNPIFVYTNLNDNVLGYAFCQHKQFINNNILSDIKTLYIDDLCVDEKERGKGIGKKLYFHVLDYAKNNDYYNVTLNVWAKNEKALRFYESLGLKMRNIYMEEIL